MTISHKLFALLVGKTSNFISSAEHTVSIRIQLIEDEILQALLEY
jgi:hypothetical protein